MCSGWAIQLYPHPESGIYHGLVNVHTTHTRRHGTHTSVYSVTPMDGKWPPARRLRIHMQDGEKWSKVPLLSIPLRTPPRTWGVTWKDAAPLESSRA